MRVAIIGGGLAGLACAYELKKNGIIPVIFEKRNCVGDPLSYAVTALRLFYGNVGDPLRYFGKKYGLRLLPMFPIKKILMHTPGKETVIKGRLGYAFKKGMESFSLENQLEGFVRLPIRFDSYVGLPDIRNEFDYIVVATGDGNIARELGLWNETFNAFSRISTILGNFETGLIKMWLNTNYAKNCYCYLVPLNTKEANLTLLVNGIGTRELDFYWEEFLREEGLENMVVSTRDAGYSLGFVKSVKVDNVYFIGNAGGFIDDFLGSGTLKCLESGILAARSILWGLDYNRLAQPLLRDVMKLHEYRKALNKLDNDGFDRLVGFLGLPVVKQIIYNNPFTRAEQGVFVARLFNAMKGRAWD